MLFNNTLLSVLLVLSNLISCASIGHEKEVKQGDELKRIFENKNDVYRINGVYNLYGDTLKLPQSAIIVFEEGARIENGVIFGNKNTIKSHSSKAIFKKTSFIGSYIGEPSAQWFSIVYKKRVDNSFELNSALNLAHLSSIKVLKLPYSKTLYVRSDIENPSESHFLYRGTVEIKSHVCFDLNKCTIRCLKNSARQYNILFSRQSENITIRHGIIVGDLKSHDGNDGEWGYGVELQGVHGFVLENLECKHCWGDGINIQVSSNGDGNPNSEITRDGHCLNGIIRNVNCHHNRRQGMSLEGVIGLEIINSTFNNTDGTNPKSGLDLEPFSIKNVVSNVIIKRCVFNNNAYSGILIMSKEGNVNNIIVDSCSFAGNKAYDITMTGKDVLVTNCHLDNKAFTLKLVGDCDSIRINSCILSKVSAQDFSKNHHVRGVVFNSCTLSPSKRRIKAAFEDNLTLTDCDITYRECKFDFSKNIFTGDGSPFLFNRNSRNQYVYENCVFYLGNNKMNSVKGQRFFNCRFIMTKKIEGRVSKYINDHAKSYINCKIEKTKGL